LSIAKYCERIIAKASRSKPNYKKITYDRNLREVIVKGGSQRKVVGWNKGHDGFAIMSFVLYSIFQKIFKLDLKIENLGQNVMLN